VSAAAEPASASRIVPNPDEVVIRITRAQLNAFVEGCAADLLEGMRRLDPARYELERDSLESVFRSRSAT
jgi:hypothetical protein